MRKTKTMTQTQRDLEKVQEQIQVFTDFVELTTYEITENFSKNGERKFYACNLEMMMEKDFVLLTDAEGIIAMDYTRVSNMFCIDSVKAVTMESVEDGEINMHFRFDFKDGYIDILSKPVRRSLAPLDEKVGEVLTEEEELHEIENTFSKYFNMTDEEMDKVYRDYYENDDGIY